MGSDLGARNVDLCSASDSQPWKQQPQVDVIYQRRKASNANKHVDVPKHSPKRISWNRKLSYRGRTSIANDVNFNFKTQQKPKGKAKPRIPKPRGNFYKPPNYDKERAYFEEVDAFELLEESPPKQCTTWEMGNENNTTIPPLSSVLRRWLFGRKPTYRQASSQSLSKILQTPAISERSFCLSTIDMAIPEESPIFESRDIQTQKKVSQHFQQNDVHFCKDRSNSIFMTNHDLERHKSSEISAKYLTTGDDPFKDLDVSISKLSLTAQSVDPFSALLDACGQQTPLTLSDAFSKYCTHDDDIKKIGEGTYAEAYKIGCTVCKIVPIDGDLPVNGEIQKRSEETLEEVVLSQTLNLLRENEDNFQNTCNFFVRTIDVSVCQGCYDTGLIRAWDDWDEKNKSENDHPRMFPDTQCYVVFVLEHGGEDLESFTLLNFNETKSLLGQVTAALAVAENAYEFEHRDLHWGNILLSRHDTETSRFTLDGKHLSVKTFGLSISIIDFTLSRINTGEDILFLDLSLDPELFEGPKHDKQSDTYRKMKAITGDCWEGSFPKTNILWLQYLVDILLLKKSSNQTSKDERDMRSLKKRLNSYESSKEVIQDPFFENLFTFMN